MKSVFGKVMWLGRATVFLVGLAVILAAVFAAASMAFAANGKPFILGKNNVATAITTLTKQGPGPTLRLLVRPGQPPMAVNSKVRVANLNADMVDGKDSTALGVTTKTSHAGTGACTTPGFFNECAPVMVKVPAGKQYHVTVWSSFAAQTGNANTGVRYCPAIKGGSVAPAQSCIATGSTPTGATDNIHLAAGPGQSAASSGEIGPLPAGTYTFSTVINPSNALAGGNFQAHTTVMVRDVSAPGPPIE